jgi:uncharacterized protein YjbI with pentapeptide repeats
MSRRWQIVLVAGLALVGLIAGTWVLYWAISPQNPAERSDFTRTVLLIIATLGLGVGLYRGWQALTAHQATQQDTAKADRERERATRYTLAVAQLGDDKSEVRLGGIYALEQIAQESDKDYRQCIEVLTAYIRGNAPWMPPQLAIQPSESQEAPLSGGAKARPRTRSSVAAAASVAVVQPKDEIQAAINVLRHRRHHFPDKESFLIDLSRTDLRGVDISGVHLEGATLRGANVSNANLAGAHLSHAHMEGAELRGAYLVKANLEGAHLEGADLRGADLSVAILTDAHLEGARLGSANLEEASLVDAYLQGASLVKADLDGADLGGAHLERAELDGVRLGDARLRGADLRNTTFDGAVLTTVRGLTWEQIEAATICDGDRIVWDGGVGDRETLNRLLPDYLVVPDLLPRDGVPAAEAAREAQFDEASPTA